MLGFGLAAPRAVTAKVAFDSMQVAPVGEPRREARFYIPALDGVRILAFLVVWQFHAMVLSIAPGTWGWKGAAVFAGSYGVPLFFVLSAFLITKLLLIERERAGRIDLKAYYARRTLRIWPLYALVVTVGLTVTHHQGLPLFGAALSLATFTANWYHGWVGLPPALGPLWSISVEEQFYLAWPLVLSFTSMPMLRRLCWVMVSVALISRLVILHFTHDWQHSFSATTSHLDSLGLGSLLALGEFRLRPLSTLRWSAYFVGCLAGLIVAAKVAPFAPWFMAGSQVALIYTIVPVLCTAMLALLLEQPRTLFASPVAVWSGRISYGLYSWHMIPMVLIAEVRTAANLSLSLGATFAMATASYYGYERPILRLKRRFEKVSSRPD